MILAVGGAKKVSFDESHSQKIGLACCFTESFLPEWNPQGYANFAEKACWSVENRRGVVCLGCLVICSGRAFLIPRVWLVDCGNPLAVPLSGVRPLLIRPGSGRIRH